jgi:glycosyltransferase involved in cell wall biosynthesis
MPYELIEAMSCGCPVVTTKTTDIVDIIKNGENGFVTNDIGEMISYIDGLLKDHNLAKSIGEKGRSTILEMCNPDWNKQLHNTIDRVPVLIVS